MFRSWNAAVTTRTRSRLAASTTAPATVFSRVRSASERTNTLLRGSTASIRTWPPVRTATQSPTAGKSAPVEL